MVLGGKVIDGGSIQIINIRMNDYPDFCDAYIEAAKFEDGTPLTESQVNDLNDEYGDDINAIIHDRQLYL